MGTAQANTNFSVSRQSAIRFIITLGTISLLADVTYEGARSINGPFLGTLGASAAVVGIVSGAGELIGYVLRLAGGVAADKTRRYWTLTVIGYVINLLAVPLMALANHWGAAAALIIAERAGKGLRTPARDVMLSQASKIVGRGWGFGLHEFMDQTGAFLGPLDSFVLIKDVQNFAEGNLVVIAVGKNGFDQLAFFGVGGFERIDERQSYFAFAQIVADGLAEYFFARGEVEDIVDQLEGDA